MEWLTSHQNRPEIPDQRPLNVLFVCERTPESLEYLREFAQRGHRFTMYTDPDRALAEMRRRPFKFDMVVIDLPPKTMDELSVE